MSPAFGKVVTEVYYKNGNECSRNTYMEESIAISSKNELWGVILDLLDKPDNKIAFTIVKDPVTKQPVRIVATKH